MKKCRYGFATKFFCLILLATAFNVAGKDLVLKTFSSDGVESSISLQQCFELAAQNAPGCYPRWMSRQQAFWTVLGVPQDEKESIFCEDGTLEHHKRGFTIMPLLYTGDKLISRDAVTVSQSLADDYLPLPKVRWKHPDIEMDITAFAFGKAGRSSVYARYRLSNPTGKEQTCRLFLLLRPFQLYPPWQGEGEGENEEEGKGLGGLSSVEAIESGDASLLVNGRYRIDLLTPPTDWGSDRGISECKMPFRDSLIENLRRGIIPDGKNVHDPARFVSVVLEYTLHLLPGAAGDIYIAYPLHPATSGVSQAITADPGQAFSSIYSKLKAAWHSKLIRVDLKIPETGFADTLKANMGYTFITLDGPALQPGSWCYDKAWIRDGTIAAVALLRLGYTNQARAFIDWYADHQYDTGEIPCVIDNKADNPFWENISEYDSQGQFIYGVLQYYLMTKDKLFLQEKLPRVVKALRYAERLREKTMTETYKNNPAFVNCRGLISKSYANHNYGDNFWTLSGWRDGAEIARILGRKELAQWMNTQHDALRQAIDQSIRQAMEAHQIDYIPEYPEGKHFWPASIAMGVACCHAAYAMPAPALSRTMDMAYERLQNWLIPGTEYRFTPVASRDSRKRAAVAGSGTAPFSFSVNCVSSNFTAPPAVIPVTSIKART